MIRGVETVVGVLQGSSASPGGSFEAQIKPEICEDERYSMHILLCVFMRALAFNCELIIIEGQPLRYIARLDVPPNTYQHAGIFRGGG